MRRRGLRWVASVAVLSLALAGCGVFGGGEELELELVAGGGDDPDAATAKELQLYGTPRGLAVSDGVVHLLASSDDLQRRLVSIEADGSVRTAELDDDGARFVAAGPAGAVYVASDDTIYRIEGAEPVPVVATEESDHTGGDALEARDAIDGLAVDGQGRLIWTEGFVGTGPEESEMSLVRVMRLDGGEVEHVAGTSSSDITGEDLARAQASPPADLAPVDFPLRFTGSEGAVAADDDGAIYLAGNDSILRLAPDGAFEVVVGPGEREAPDEPYGDEGDAADFGGVWVGSSIDVSGDTVVATDRAYDLDADEVDAEPFVWTSDDFSDGANEIAERIIHAPPESDGTFDVDSDTIYRGTVAVVVRDGTAATAMAHASRVAVEDGTLYAVGQTHDGDSAGSEDAEMLIVKAELSDE